MGILGRANFSASRNEELNIKLGDAVSMQVKVFLISKQNYNI